MIRVARALCIVELVLLAGVKVAAIESLSDTRTLLVASMEGLIAAALIAGKWPRLAATSVIGLGAAFSFWTASFGQVWTGCG